jgi:hypothetical protein
VVIRLTSTATAEQEGAVVPVLMKAIVTVLDMLPICYALRIETSDAHVFEHASTATSRSSAAVRPA